LSDKTSWSPKQLAKLLKAFAMMVGGGDKEREAARGRILQMLESHGDGWNDLATRIAEAQAQTSSAKPTPPPQAPGQGPITGEELFRVIRAVFERFVWFKDPHYYDACALWVMFDHVFSQFRRIPILHLRTRRGGRGKTTVFDCLEPLVARPYRDDNTTAAAVADAANEKPTPTLLLDEGDNLDLMNHPTFRAVLNACNRRGGKRTIKLRGRRVTFDLFAPIVLASNKDLPPTTMRRSVVIHMGKAPQSQLAKLDKREEEDPEQKELFDLIYQPLVFWAHKVKLNWYPKLPEGLSSSAQDAWRPLISVADACGPEIGKIAREAAIAISGGYGEDLSIRVLADLRTVIKKPVEELPLPETRTAVHEAINSEMQLTTQTILLALEDANSFWGEWTGDDGKRDPHALTDRELRSLLHDFLVSPRVLWPALRLSTSRSARGYRREDIEKACSVYLDGESDDTASQASNIINLLRHNKRHGRRS
jgi:hypothetical protein